MEKILLTTQPEYDFVVSRGYQPLLHNKFFRLDIRLRESIQAKMFGHSEKGRGKNIMATNERFFKWVWEHSAQVCSECMKPLREYSAVYISHILSRGAYPECSIDPRNTNILCFEHHSMWENGNRKTMRIYPGNQRIIKELLQDYNIRRKGK